VPKFPLDPRLLASPLLASTCVAALLLGTAPAKAGQVFTTPQASVTNPAGQATTSIVITGTTVTGAVANAGTISPGTLVGANTAALAVTNSTIGGGITSRIALGNYGTLIPEVRLGWNHEFLDASQKITAALVGVAGSGFSATGIAFGRDAALIGAGFSMELSPDAKVFVDYDGRLASRLQEHSISGGLKVRF